MANQIQSGWDIETKKGGNKVTYFSLKQGESAIIRFVDQAPTMFWSHWLPQVRRSIVCLGDNCPICNYLSGLAKEEKSKAKAGNSRKFAMQVIDRTDNTLKLYEMGITVITQLKELMNEMGDLRNFDIKVKRTSDGYIFFPQAPKPFSDADGVLYTQKVDLAEFYENKRKGTSPQQAQELLDGVPPEVVYAKKEDKAVPSDFEDVVFGENPFN